MPFEVSAVEEVRMWMDPPRLVWRSRVLRTGGGQPGHRSRRSHFPKPTTENEKGMSILRN